MATETSGELCLLLGKLPRFDLHWGMLIPAWEMFLGLVGKVTERGA